MVVLLQELKQCQKNIFYNNYFNLRCLNKSDMQEDNNHQEDDALQFSSLALFDDDPLSPDFSLLQPEIEVHHYEPHLLQKEELLSDIHFKVSMQADCRKGKAIYELVITSYRLILFELLLDKEQTKKKQQSKLPISLPYGFVEEVDLVKKEVLIIAKSGIVYRLKPYSQVKNIYQIILYGFTYIPFFTKQVLEEEQTPSYDSLAELERMRIPWDKYIIIPNNNGNLSSTYPKYFIIAKTITESLLEECIKVRNNGRIPVLTYFHEDYNAALWRAARPKMNQENNKFNKAYLKELSRDLVVMDFRDEEVGLKEKENKGEIQFKKFESLTSVHEILKKILIAYAKDESILRTVSKWFEDVNQIIMTSYLIIEYLQNGKEVLLQQNFGFDRVAQVAALVQLIIDPFYRTIHGFGLLIEKEFVSFGHPFARRLGFERQKIAESSPIFIQFLECVNQLQVTHPKCFQFSSFFLARIGYEAYSAKYNNFFFNTQKERLSSKFTSKTPSIWKMPMRKEYYNYQWVEKEAVQSLTAIRKAPSVKEYIIWREYYDLITQMTCQNPYQSQVKQRKNSLYKVMHRADSKEF